MKNADFLTGADAERWFRKFAEHSSILAEIDVPLEFLVRLLDKDLNKRLQDCRSNMYANIPLGNEWIAEILSGRITSEITQKQRQELKQYLLDRVVATDSTIKLNDEAGMPRMIAVDVTVNSREECIKLNRIQGKPEFDERVGFNRNQNIPGVRKVLGINKHLILVLSQERQQLPSYKYLLTQLQAFANEKSKTRALNLIEVPEGERYQWNMRQQAINEKVASDIENVPKQDRFGQTQNLDSRKIWDKFIQGVPPQAKHLMSAEALVS